MVVTTRRNTTWPNIAIGGSTVTRVENCRYLGLHIDDKLGYHKHIEILKKNLSGLCGTTYRLRYKLILASTKKLYYSCIYSALSNCITVWGGVLLSTHRADRFPSLQRKIVNIFTCFYPNTESLFKSAGILKLADIYKFKVLIYMFRILNLGECPSLETALRLNLPVYRLNSSVLVLSREQSNGTS